MPTTLTPEQLDTAAVRAGGIPASREGRMEWAVAGVDVRLTAGYGYTAAIAKAAAKFHLNPDEVEDEYLRRKLEGE